MSKIKGRDTKPEIQVRKMVHAMGFRYRLHRKDLPGCPDLALISRKKAIFVHGCFWHQHLGCKRATIPKTNPIFWEEKLKENQERDERVQLELTDMGWEVLVIWQCQMKNLEYLLASFLLG
ncbi:MAG: very short patch repair endonuclease [Pseudomonadota bacterium]